MRFEDERYVRVFTRDTTTWLMWSWQARFVFMSLLRKVDRAGVVNVGAHGLRGLSVLIGVPLEIVETGMAELLADETVKGADGAFVIPKFLAAQECSQSDKARQLAKRERDRVRIVSGGERGDSSREPTKRDETSRNVTQPSRIVTERHETSRAVTPRHALSLRTVPSVPSVPDPPKAPPPGGSALSRLGIKPDRTPIPTPIPTPDEPTTPPPLATPPPPDESPLATPPPKDIAALKAANRAKLATLGVTRG